MDLSKTYNGKWRSRNGISAVGTKAVLFRTSLCTNLQLNNFLYSTYFLILNYFSFPTFRRLLGFFVCLFVLFLHMAVSPVPHPNFRKDLV